MADNEFDSEKMFDFINRGKDRKVNFVILPKLFADNNYLKNGKYWVFTYKKILLGSKIQSIIQLMKY